MVDPKKEVVEVVPTKTQLCSLQVRPPSVNSTDQQHTSFETLHCTQSAFKIKALGYVCLGIGRNIDGQVYLVLLEKACSLANVRKDWMFPWGSSCLPISKLLEGVVADVVARAIVRLSSSHDCTVLICSQPSWSSRIAAVAENAGKNIVFITRVHKSSCEGATHILNYSLDTAVWDKIISWSQNTVQISVRTAAESVRFTTDKTYMIIGTSDIARSICEWIAGRGANYFVIVSRSTGAVSGWAGSMRKKGIVMRLQSADITNEASFNKVMSSVMTSGPVENVKLPPVGGVIDLATVFRDGAFTNISYNDFKAVADVKAKGSLVLHNAFLNTPLDFFILKSSLSFVTGSPGQANCNLGNAFMASLAQYLWSLGLPALVVHLDTVAGIGHMARQGSTGPGGLQN